MRRPKPKSRKIKLERRESELNEIEILIQWIEFQKPDRGSNPLSLPPLPEKSKVGRIKGSDNDDEHDSVVYSSYAGCELFNQLPISKKTKKGLMEGKFVRMTDVQRATLPHSLCGRDILGAAKTGSGKTLAFIIPVLEKLYRERWGPEDGVGCIILSPTRDLGSQIFGVLNLVGKHHGFSAGLLIGGRKGVDAEKQRVNELNILVCTPGRLLQHMDETPNFDCSQLQILVLDEADRVLDNKFKAAVNAIISQLPTHRQTLLFSATQTKSVKDLARLSLKDPEYLSVHEEATVATPHLLKETAIIVPLHQKLDLLWSFIKTHLNSRILVFLTTRKQVTYVYRAFRHLRPGISLMCLHAKMNQEQRLRTYSKFCDSRAVLFSTDVASRGLDFNKAVQWVVQVDCSEDVATYIHRVGRTARYNTGGNSLLFLEPSEEKMLKKLETAKIPIKKREAKKNQILSVTPLLGAVLAKIPELQGVARRAFVTYLQAICKRKDKEVFDVTKIDTDEFAASLGLPMTPKVRFLKRKNKETVISPDGIVEKDSSVDESDEELLTRKSLSALNQDMNETETFFGRIENHGQPLALNDPIRARKRKKVKISVDKPTGTKTIFDEENDDPLGASACGTMGLPVIDMDEVQKRVEKARKQLAAEDNVDKLQARRLRKERELKKKLKRKRGRTEDEEEEDEEPSASDGEVAVLTNKNSKVYFHSDSEEEERREKKSKKEVNSDVISLGEQEALALKLLSSMH
ncbi:DEAD-box ATP-dependent RNA helicase 32-like protein [Drosera capensis]